MMPFRVIARRPWACEGAHVEGPDEPEQVEGRAREFPLSISCFNPLQLVAF
jgi:hypothetical protein